VFFRGGVLSLEVFALLPGHSGATLAAAESDRRDSK